MNFKTRLSVLLVSTPLLAFVLVGGLLGNASAGTDDTAFRHLKVFQNVIGLVVDTYVEEVDVNEVTEGALRGLASALDADSAYLSPNQLKEMESGAPLPDGDIGVELTRQFYLRIIAARDGSPAAEAGLQTGDHVRAIDGRSTRGLSVFEGSRLLRGAPGSKVVLTVIRGNAAEPHEVTLVRTKPARTSVSSKMLGTEVGYLRIPAFDATTAKDVKRHAEELERAGAKGLLIDVRRTAQGRIEDGLATARLFVASGTLTSKAGRAPEGQKDPVKQPVTAVSGDGAVDLPAQLLVSAGTSGAAEVFAAALDGNGRADLIGEHTIGRAAEQKLVKLPDSRALWLTHVRYYTPEGKLIHGQGLEPDVALSEPDVEFGGKRPESDPMLDAAVKRLTESILLKRK